MINNRVFSNLIWRFFERSGAQGVAFIVSIILARLLDPEVYGTVAIVTAITTILQVFVDSGFANALIQKKDADDVDFSSVFYFNVLICIIIYLLLFLTAPFISGFYNRHELTPLIRVLGVVIVISGLRNIQQAYVSKKLLFKRFFYSTLSGTIVAAAVGISMAYMGYGVWALVAQTIVSAALGTVVLWFTVEWRPKRCFSFDKLKILFSYGWKLLASGLVDTVSQQLWQLIIGKRYSNEDLAFYNKGNTFPNLIVTNINSSIDSVLLPVLSEQQENIERVKSMTRRSIQISSYIMWPLMIGLFVCARPMVCLLLTEKWLPCVPFIRIFSLSYALYPIHTANLNAIKAVGRSDLFLKLEIIKKIINLMLLLSTMWFGIKAMAYGVLAEGIICQIINAFPNSRLINYKYTEQLLDILPSVAVASIMGICVSVFKVFNFSNLATLSIQIPVGVALYIVLSKLLHIGSYDYLKKIAKKYLNKTENI